MAAAVLTFLLLSFLSPVVLSEPPSPDVVALLSLKDSFTIPDPDPLTSWSATASSNPCDDSAPWFGVICFNGIVTGLRLANLNLSGSVNIDALAHFKSLRSVSFNGNRFSGPIPPFGRLDALKSVYLSGNNFSGEIPADFFAKMDHLKKLWLDANSFSGEIPQSLAKSTSLIELHLENNRFTGEIPDLAISSLKIFSAAENALSGAVPKSLVKFGAIAFQGNAGLCGPPISDAPCGAPPSSAEPPPVTPTAPARESNSGKLAVVMIVFFLLCLALLIGWGLVKKRRSNNEFSNLGEEVAADAMEAAAAAAAASPIELSHKQLNTGSGQKRAGSGRGGSKNAGAGGGGGAAELVMVNEERGIFGLPDLMKAAAEVLGNGGLGSAYKAVMGNGVAVAVKRVREMNRIAKDVFDADMRRMGRLRHPNVLTPLAYHYRKEEKLIVSEFVSKGSLLYILHGDRGSDHAALDWATRLKIIRGIVRGMAYLHAELPNLDVPHGNLKSGNILLSPDFDPLVVDYGFVALVNPSQVSNLLFAYKSPEAIQFRHVSPKSDVYCLGIVILEVLTGKFPSQYLNNTKGGTDVVQWTASAIAERREGELLDPDIAKPRNPAADMVRLLRIGAACTDSNPEKRPDMKEVAALVEEIAGAGGGGGGGGTESRSGRREEEEAVGPPPSLMDGYPELSGSSQRSSIHQVGSTGQGPQTNG